MSSSSSDSLSATPQRLVVFSKACSSFLVWLDSRNRAGVSSHVRDYGIFPQMQEKCWDFLKSFVRRSGMEVTASTELRVPSEPNAFAFLLGTRYSVLATSHFLPQLFPRILWVQLG